VPGAKLNLSEDQHLKCCFFQVTPNNKWQKAESLFSIVNFQ
jgi:hypothetical protein